MSIESAQLMSAFSDLIRTRLRAALLPISLISLFGLFVYSFFSFINLNGLESVYRFNHDYKNPRIWVDPLGRFGSANYSQLLKNSNSSEPSHHPINHSIPIMELPILHHTFQDPFDPKSGFQPIPDAKSPWSATTPAEVQLINRLSRNRFPSPDTNEAHRSRSRTPPPPLPPWPPRSLLSEKASQLKNPIPHHLIHGLNTSYVWKDRPLIQKGQLRKVQWSGFDQPDWESHSDRDIRLERQGWVRRGFQHVWEGYKARAWGHDELKPTSGSFQDPFGGWGATLIDSLDTLLIMNLTRDYNYARTHVRAIDWAHTIELGPVDPNGQQSISQLHISVFETAIRYLGGLISAYDLSGDKLMLDRAEELAQWLLPAFGTSSGLPLSRYQMGSNPSGRKIDTVCLAEIGSLTLEFTRLSQLTSKEFYYDVVQKITDLLDKTEWSSSGRLGTLFPTHFSPRPHESLSGRYTFGAMADSYYEYLIKEHQLLRGSDSQYGRMFVSAMESARAHLIKTYELESPNGKNITVIGDTTWGTFKPSLNHLACFSGAMIGLGAKLLNRQQDLDLALKHADACVWMYESTKTRLGPEEASITQGDGHTRWQKVLHEGQNFRELKPTPIPGVTIHDGRYLGRPETIESVYYMWRITGDRKWQDRGWRMFTNWMKCCITPFGMADLKDVNVLPPDLSDKQESFVLGETFKYYYLLFSEPSLLSLDDFVLNTEAHPFRIDTGKLFKTFWTGPDEEIDKKYRPPWVKENETGFGTFLQQWSRVVPTRISHAQRQIYNKVLGVNNQKSESNNGVV